MYDYMKLVMKRYFPKYKRIQVAATLSEIEIVQKKLNTEYKLFGIKIKSEYSYTKKVIPLVEFTIVSNNNFGLFQSERYQIYVAVDETNKTVYWNFTSLPNKYRYQ